MATILEPDVTFGDDQMLSRTVTQSTNEAPNLAKSPSKFDSDLIYLIANKAHLLNIGDQPDVQQDNVILHNVDF